ncbi:hypothetical protein B0O80DRAFT_486116 [Mortierella sp. GBAus27b]|nr:hypothetical protein B0O80DRAFT_486116 [Mortierella sp. GBAus27b]
MFGGIVSSPLNILSPTQALELAHVYLENASTAKDPMVALVLCHDTETSLSQARRSTKNAQAPSLREKIANAYIELGRFLNSCGHGDEAQSSFKKAESMGSTAPSTNSFVTIEQRTSTKADGSTRSVSSFEKSLVITHKHVEF